MGRITGNHVETEYVSILTSGMTLEGDLAVPDLAQGVILFAHGSGSSRHSSRNKYVASVLNRAGFATLLIDLLTRDEERIDNVTAHIRFDIGLLADRLVGAVEWLNNFPRTNKLKVGLFGASTGGGAAIVAAARHPEQVFAVVSRGGRPDLAGQSLQNVQAPVLLIVGGNDLPVIKMNQDAFRIIKAEKRLEIVPGATHLFEEPGKLDEVSKLAQDWFIKYA